MSLHAAEPLRKTLSVTVVAPPAYLGASRDRVPGGIGPFDCRMVSHWLFSLSTYPTESLRDNSARFPFDNIAERCDLKRHIALACSASARDRARPSWEGSDDGTHLDLRGVRVLRRGSRNAFG